MTYLIDLRYEQMKKEPKKFVVCLLRPRPNSGFSLVELLVVMVIIASLVALAIPAINAMQKSFNSTGAEGMISTALATARTLAISRGEYAGVRFQKVYNPADALKAEQYMIFIVYDSKEETGTSGWVCGFVAVDGYKPMKLPSNIGVVDLMVRNNHGLPRDCGQVSETNLGVGDLDDSVAANLDLSGNNINITDISTFSIVFSPAGKLVIQDVRCGKRRNNNDDIFNTIVNLTGVPPAGMFIEDNHDDYGIGVEMSRREFYIYNRDEFEGLTTGAQRMGYLNGPKTERYSVNPYTGELIK
jgi:prepilin-type N-terminal cleavage/methylation domain-containing protein